jgi:hypothetical protein
MEQLWNPTPTNGSQLAPASPDVRVFRFLGISAPEALYKIHRQLVEKYAGGMWPAGEPRDSEIQRLVRVFENYGPRHMKIGYMKLTKDGSAYRLTWRGAFLMAWRGPWSASECSEFGSGVRCERHELEGREVAALQKACIKTRQIQISSVLTPHIIGLPYVQTSRT